MSASPHLVQPDEKVLRRVHRNHSSPTLPRTIHLAAFRPCRADVTGLSVFREAYISVEEVAASGRKPGEYLVVRLSVQALNQLGLTVVPEETPEGPRGHAVIPELRLEEYERNKQRMKDILLELARLASQDVVLEPPT